jgi:hypothetical protein
MRIFSAQAHGDQEVSTARRMEPGPLKLALSSEGKKPASR